MGNHSVDLRQNGKIIASILCDFFGNAVDLNLSLDDRSLGKLCGLDAYEGDYQLRFAFEEDEKGLAVFHDAKNRARLVLPPGKIGSVRVEIEEGSINLVRA